jgi:hypothetical protein
MSQPIARLWPRVCKWLELDSYFANRNKTAPRKARQSYLPRLEELERRECPSVTMSNPGDQTNSAGDGVYR